VPQPASKNRNGHRSHSGHREFSEVLKGNLTPEDKVRWDREKARIRKLEGRRKLTNGEIFERILEDGLPIRTEVALTDTSRQEQTPARPAPKS